MNYINTHYITPIFIFLIIIAAMGCNKEENNTTFLCKPTGLDGTIPYNGLIDGMNDEFITGTTEQPDASGALGRNKNGYFHVRFQFKMSNLTDYAIHFNSEQAVAEYLKSLTYAFKYQNTNGDFQFVPPDDIVNSNGYIPATAGDLASATAFFAYSLGISLHSLSQSDWFTGNASLHSARFTIDSLKPGIIKMLHYLKENEPLLKSFDADSPNRSLFDALAFYTLGIYLNDSDAVAIGRSFAENALSLRDTKAGYFIEAGGWDSSYNGVAIKLGFELFTLLTLPEDQQLRLELEQAVTCAADWQRSRILSTGEISTQGNTRVFKGGETFVGSEKEVDVEKTLRAFFYMGTLSGDVTYIELVHKVLAFYD